MAAAVAMLFLGQALITDLHSILSKGLAFNPINIENPEALYEQISKSVGAGLLAVVPLFVLFIIAAFLGPVSMGGWAFSLDSLAPKLEKLSPIKGFGRMFGLQSLVELFKALLKFLLVAAVAFLIIYYSVPPSFLCAPPALVPWNYTATTKSGFELVKFRRSHQTSQKRRGQGTTAPTPPVPIGAPDFSVA